MRTAITLLTALLLAPLTASAQPIRLHPENPRVFAYLRKPLVLIAATEHYGAVMDRPFRREPYLDDLVDKRMTASRLFVLYRELQTAVNPYSTCKPETLDYIDLIRAPGRAMPEIGCRSMISISGTQSSSSGSTASWVRRRNAASSSRSPCSRIITSRRSGS